MRDILRKAATASMIAGAALAVAACGGNKATNTTNTSTMPVDTYNSMDTMGNMMMDNTNMMSSSMNSMNSTMSNMSGEMNHMSNTVDHAAGNHSGAAAH